MVNAVEINKQISIIFIEVVEHNNILKPCDSYNPVGMSQKNKNTVWHGIPAVYLLFVNQKDDQNFSLYRRVISVWNMVTNRRLNKALG